VTTLPRGLRQRFGCGTLANPGRRVAGLNHRHHYRAGGAREFSCAWAEVARARAWPAMLSQSMNFASQDVIDHARLALGDWKRKLATASLHVPFTPTRPPAENTARKNSGSGNKCLARKVARRRDLSGIGFVLPKISFDCRITCKSLF
jgi:hypothetical protein